MAQIDPFEQALASEGLLGTPLEAIARATMKFESGGNPQAVSNRGARGRMQVMPGTFNEIADPGWDINNDYHNSRAGMRYLRQGFDKSGGDPALTGAYYYGGPGGMAKAQQGIPVSDPKNPNNPNTLEYGQRLADSVGQGRTGMNSKLPLTMAQMKQMTPEIFAQLSGLVDDPEITPELAQAITNKRQKNIQALPLAMGAMLSGDKGIRDVGTDLHQRGQDARNLAPVGDEGFVDPETGQILANPEGPEKRQLALAGMAGDVASKMANTGGNLALAGATLENTQWYQRNKLALEGIGVNLNMVKNKMDLFQMFSDPETRFRAEQAGIDLNGLTDELGGAPAGGQPTPNQPMPNQPMPGQPTPNQPMPGQPVPGMGGEDMGLAESMLPLATGAALGQATPTGPTSALPGATGQTPRTYDEIPGGNFYGFDPVTNQQVVEKNSKYFRFEQDSGKFVEIDAPGFDGPDIKKANADADLAQGQVDDRNTWAARQESDPLSPFATYEDYKKNVGTVRAEAQKLLGDAQEQTRADRELNADLLRFRELNADRSTGGFIQRSTSDTAAERIMFPGSAEMRAISSRVKANSVPKGQGSVSDGERRLFGDAVPGTQYDSAVNDSIIDMQMMKHKYREDFAGELQKFVAERGHTNGAVEYVNNMLIEKYENDPEYQRLKALLPGSISESTQDDSGFEIISIE